VRETSAFLVRNGEPASVSEKNKVGSCSLRWRDLTGCTTTGQNPRAKMKKDRFLATALPRKDTTEGSTLVRTFLPSTRPRKKRKHDNKKTIQTRGGNTFRPNFVREPSKDDGWLGSRLSRMRGNEFLSLFFLERGVCSWFLSSRRGVEGVCCVLKRMRKENDAFMFLLVSRTTIERSREALLCFVQVL